MRIPQRNRPAQKLQGRGQAGSRSVAHRSAAAKIGVDDHREVRAASQDPRTKGVRVEVIWRVRQRHGGRQPRCTTVAELIQPTKRRRMPIVSTVGEPERPHGMLAEPSFENPDPTVSLELLLIEIAGMREQDGPVPTEPLA